MQNDLDREAACLQELEAQKQDAQDRLEEMDQQKHKLEDMLNEVRIKCQEESQMVSNQSISQSVMTTFSLCVGVGGGAAITVSSPCCYVKLKLGF